MEFHGVLGGLYPAAGRKRHADDDIRIVILVNGFTKI